MSSSVRSQLHWKGWAAAVAMILASVAAGAHVWRKSMGWGPSQVSDALPLFLGARAVRSGLDPTDPTVLEQMYQAANIGVSKALFSVLYPASTSVLLSPLGGLNWPDFIYGWRLVVFAMFIAGCAAAGAGHGRGPRCLFNAALGAVVGLLLFPLTTAALGLGQANLAIVGCFGLVMGALAQGWGRTAAAAVILGAAIKLVPAAALWPVLCSKQWRVLRAVIVAGLGVLVLTWSCVPIDRIIDNFFRTVAFQRGVEPHWLHDFSLPDGLRYLGHFRRPSLGLWTLLLTGWCAWSCRGQADLQREVLPIGVALLAAALAVDAAAVGVFYSTMCIPAMVVLVTGPLQAGRHPLLWLLTPLALGPLLMHDATLGNADEHPRMVAGAALAWAGAAAQLWVITRSLSRRSSLTLGGLLVAGLTQAWIWTYHPPYFGKPPQPPQGTHSIGGPAPLPKHPPPRRP